jgi:glycosyltransferase involved in cell wall biosynthesis
MRVCLVSNEFAPFHGAGIGTYASLMAAAWAGAGHEVHVLTGAHAGVAEDGPRLRPGVSFHVVSPERDARIGTWAEGYALGVLSVLRNLHAQRPFDYIEFPDYGGEGAYAVWAHRTCPGAPGLAGAVLGVRLHTPRRECRALNQESWLDEEGARVDALEDWAIRGADVLISPSASLLEIVRARLGGTPDWPSEVVVPYPFDRAAVAELLPDHGPPETPGDGGPPTVLYYGRLERRKGVHLLVEAARRMLDAGEQVRFRLMGGDTRTGPMGASMREHLERLAGPHAHRGIEFLAPRPRKELGEVIRRAAVVCVPSLWENFPNVVLESMALGTCTVGSDAGGIGEIIRDGEDGLLFRAGDGEDLERVLRRAIQDADLRRRIAGAAPGRIAELCDPAQVVAQTARAISAARARAATTEREPGSVSVVIVVGHTDDGLPETIASAGVPGGAAADCTVAVYTTPGPERGAIAARVDRAVKQAACEAVALDHRGAGPALNAAMSRGRGDWICVLEPGDVLAPGSLAALTGADPDAMWLGGLTRWEGGAWGPAPTGLEPDLLAAGLPPGLGLVRREAIERAGGWGVSEAGSVCEVLWSMACRLAAARERWALVPDVAVSRPPGRGIGPARGVTPASLMDGGMDGGAHPAADAGRVARSLAARAVRAEQRAADAEAAEAAARARLHSMEMGWDGDGPPYGPRRAIHREAVFRQRFMEQNLKYRVADRVNAALKATGVQRPLKALAGGLRGLVRRLTGG